MKNRLITLLTFCILTSTGWAVQDTSQTATQSGTRQGSRSSAIPDTSAAINLSGRVLMADGSPLPQSVRVDLSCHGSISRQTYASNDGQFRMELGFGGQFGTGLTDASASAPGSTAFGSPAVGQASSIVTGRKLTRGLALGRVDLTDCEIQVNSVPGYRAEPIELGMVGEFEGDVGNLYLSPLHGVTGTTVSSKSLLAPKSAVKEFEKARKELARKTGRPSEAEKELHKALQVYPNFPEAWNLLGELRYREKDLPEAREAFRKAIDLDPRYITPCLSLAKLELEDNRWDEAARWSDRIVELNSYIPQGQYLHALAHFQLHDFAMAEKSILTLRRDGKEPEWPFIHFMMGEILANRGDYTAAAWELGSFLNSPHPPSAAPMVENARDQLADWERRGLIHKP